MSPGERQVLEKLGEAGKGVNEARMKSGEKEKKKTA